MPRTAVSSRSNAGARTLAGARGVVSSRTVVDGGAPTLGYQTNLVLWYKPEGLVGFNNNDLMGTWNDSSITGLNITAVSSYEPTYKTNVLNGYAGVYFASKQMKTTQGTATWTPPVSMFVVYNTTVNSQQTLVGDLNPAAGDYKNTILLTVDANKTWLGNNSSYVVSTSLYNDTNFHYICGVVNGASSALFKDGSADGTGTCGSLTVDGALMGARSDLVGSFFTGYIVEYLLYNEAISAENQATVESYLSTKYAL